MGETVLRQLTLGWRLGTALIGLLLGATQVVAQPAACDAEFTPIFQVQGRGTTSPLAQQTVTTRGVVTGDFQGASQLNGFFIQDPNGDDDPLTSDGVFVFVPANNPVSSVDV